MAVTNGHRAVVEVLLRHDANVHQSAGRDADGETSLHYVTDIQYADDLLQGLGCDGVDSFSWSVGTPLHSALESYRIDIVLALIRFGADVNRRDYPQGCTPLHLTADARLANWLLDHGADVNAPNCNGSTPLHCALEIQDEHLIDVLLERGADVNVANNDGNTPLMVVGKYFPLVDIARKLIEHGARLSVQNVKGRTALHAAVIEDEVRIVSLLLDAAPRLCDVVDMDGNRPLHFAHSKQVLRTLIEKADEDLNATNYMGATLLCVFIKTVHELKTTASFMKAILDRCPGMARTHDDLGNTPLHYAAVSYRLISESTVKGTGTTMPYIPLECFRMLISRGGCVNARNAFGQTPLQLCDNDETVNLLLKSGADVAAQDNLGQTFINNTFDHPWLIRFLNLENVIYKTIDENRLTDCRNRTVLHSKLGRTKHCDMDNARIIRSGNCEVNAIDWLGKTALHYAAHTKSSKCFTDYDELVNCGALTNILDIDGCNPRDIYDWKRAWNAEFDFKRKELLRPLNYVHRDTLYTFKLMCQTRRLCVCSNSCHRHESEDGKHLPSCLYRLRPERDPAKYVFRIWSELEYAYRHPLWSAINRQVGIFMQKLTTEVRRRDGRFKGKLIQVGSSFEETKLREPNEFDFNIELVRFSRLCFPVPVNKANGFFSLQLNTDTRTDNFNDFFSDDGFLLTTLVNLKFEMIVKEILHDASFWCNERYFECVGTEAKELYAFSSTKCAITVQLRTFRKLSKTENVFFDDVISIDIAPVIRIPGWWPNSDHHYPPLENFDEAVANDVLKYGCMFVFAQPSKIYRAASYSNTSAMVSFAFAESRLIRSCPSVIKAAYMVCKWLINNYCDSLPSLCEFSSHSLKTAVLVVLSASAQKPLTYGSYDDIDAEELTKWVGNICGCLVRFAVQDSVPSFFIPSFHKPVWKFERFQKFSSFRSRCSGMDYKEIVDSHPIGIAWCSAPLRFREYGLWGFALTYLIYWSVLKEGTEMKVDYQKL